MEVVGAATRVRTHPAGRAAAGLAGAALWCGFAAEHIAWFVRTGRPVGLGLGATELLAAGLFLGRRSAEDTSARARDWAVAFGGAFGALAARPGGAHAAVTDVAGMALQGAGLLVVFLALARLGRSFGLVAARRDLVTSGPYRIVRHPLYAAYVLVQAGYLLQSPRAWNAGVFAFVWACQVARVRAEERLLAAHPAYADYMRRTPFRLVPGIW